MAQISTRKLQMITMQKNLWLMFNLNYNFVRDVLKKIALDPNLWQENCRFWMIATGEDTERLQGIGMKSTRTIKHDRMEA